MKSWFFKRGYTENVIDEEIKKLKFSKKGSKKSKGSKGVPFMVTYHPPPPPLNCVSRMINHNLNILYMSSEAEAIFSPGPMVSFRHAS